MKKIMSILVVAFLFIASEGVAAGLSYAVTLEQAKEQLRKDSSKHMLVFYTEGW